MHINYFVCVFSRIPGFVKVEQVVRNIFITNLPDLLHVLMSANCEVTSNTSPCLFTCLLFIQTFSVTTKHVDKHKMCSNNVSKYHEGWLHLNKKKNQSNLPLIAQVKMYHSSQPALTTLSSVQLCQLRFAIYVVYIYVRMFFSVIDTWSPNY